MLIRKVLNVKSLLQKAYLEPVKVSPARVTPFFLKKPAGKRFLAGSSFPYFRQAPLAERLADRLEIHYTPKHGSWLNIAEIELNVLKRQCLAGRIDCIEKMRAKVAAWNADQNNRQTKVDWQFRTNDARIKLKRLYPKL